MNGKPITPKEERIIRHLYPDTSTKVIAQGLHCSLGRVYSAAWSMGLQKSKAYMAGQLACRLRRGDQIGKAFRFPPGHVPHNKGTRRPGWAVGRMAETQFKKGVSLNKMPIGATRLVSGYVYRKVSDIPKVPWTRNWRVEHHLVWEQAGRKPINFHTHALIFKDGNRTNTALSNLQRITRGQLMQRNSIHYVPPELKEVIRLKANINNLLTRRKRKAGHGQEQTQRPARPSLRDPGSASRQRQPDGHSAGADDQRGSADAG